jgi:hypothetical protein
VNVNVSGPVRVFALVGGLAALALWIWFFLLGGLAPSVPTEPAPVIKPLSAGKKTSAARTAKQRTSAAPTPPKRATTPAASAGKPKPKPSARPVTLANPEKLPLAVVRALVRSPLVVVSLYSPESKLDLISLGEARAGARRANVAFVALNALDRRSSEALTRKLGVLSAPAFFLYKRPGKLVMRIDGFADRDLVAQAAVAALPPAVRHGRQAGASPPAKVTQARWSNRANAICVEGGIIPTTNPSTRSEVLAAWPALLADFKRDIGRLKALPLPTSSAARARTRNLLAAWGGVHAAATRLLAAMRANDKARFEPLLSALGESSLAANQLAARVGATACTVT